MSPLLLVLIGFILGQLVPSRRIHEWRRVVTHWMRRLRPWLHDHVVGVAVTGLVVAMVTTCAFVIGAGYAIQRQRDYATCQASVNSTLLEALHARSDTAREAILAPSMFFSVLLDALTHPNGSEQHQARVLAKLIAANRAAKSAYYEYIQTQQDNPLPKLPDCGSGG